MVGFIDVINDVVEVVVDATRFMMAWLRARVIINSIPG